MKKIMIVLAMLAVLVSACQTYQPARPVRPEPVLLPEPQLEPSVSVLEAPKTVSVGEQFTVAWRVGGPATTIPHTAVHYGPESKPGLLGVGVGPAGAGYPEFTKEFASGTFSIPKSFAAVITAKSAGSIYYRVHAIVNRKNYWTDEFEIKVQEPEASETKKVQEGLVSQNVKASIVDFGFVPKEIRVRKGDSVTWTNKGSAPHTVTSTSGPATFDSKLLHKGKSFTQTFNVAGTYLYKCSIHPAMRAKVIVEE